MKCHQCGSENITYYRQIRRDGVSVITARCENGHIPEKGKPFYSLSLFNVYGLPLLPGTKHRQEIPTPRRDSLFSFSKTKWEQLMGDDE